MDGLGGYEVWQWIFLIGRSDRQMTLCTVLMITRRLGVCLGCAVPFILNNSIRKSNKWLDLTSSDSFFLSHFLVSAVKARHTAQTV